MDLEKIVAILNIARKDMRLPLITVEQYKKHLAQTGNYEIELHKASAEATRRHVARQQLRHKYPAPEKTPLSRCYYNLMKEERTPEDEEYNRGIIEKLKTREGTASLIEDIFRQAAQLPASVYFPANKGEMIASYEKYGHLLDTLNNIKLITADMKTYGMSFSPAAEQFINTHSGAWEAMNKQWAQVRKWGSPFYPYLGNADFANIMKLAGGNQNDKSMEQEVFSIFSSDSSAEIGLEAEIPFMNGGLMLLKRGELDNHLLLNEDLYKLAAGANENTAAPVSDGISTDDVLGSLSGHFIKDEMPEAPAVNEAAPKRQPAPAAEKKQDDPATLSQIKAGLEKGAWTPEIQNEIPDQQASLINLFGPEFRYEEKHLKIGTYTKEVFKVDNYSLPEGSPFTDAQAALIGVAAFSLPGIGDQSRMDIPEESRLDRNFSFVTENMIFATPRQGFGDLVHHSVNLARNAVVPLITGYMKGEKEPLANAIASSLEKLCDGIKASDLIQENGFGFASAITGYMDMLEKDPELMTIVKKSGVLSEDHFNMAKLASRLADLHKDKQDAMKEYYDEISAGKIPSPEIKKNLAVKTLAIDIINAQKVKDKAKFQNLPDVAARLDEIYKLMRSDSSKIRTAVDRQKQLFASAPLSPFMLKAATPEGMDELGKMIEGSEEFQKLISADEARFVSSLKLDTFNILDGRISSKIRGELDKDNALLHFGSDKPAEMTNEELYKSGNNNYKAAVLSDSATEKSIFIENAAKPGTYILLNTKAQVRDVNMLFDRAKDAQQSVHMGSKQYDNVEKDLEMLTVGCQKLQEDPKMTAKRADLMGKACSQLISDCNAYLKRKAQQGELNADPLSKTGKRIAAVKAALKFGLEYNAKYEDISSSFSAIKQKEQQKEEQKELIANAQKQMYNALTPQTVGPLLKELNHMAASNTDPARGEKIVSQIKMASQYIKENKLQNRVCGLEPKDYQQAIRAIENGGIAKAAQPENKIEEKKADQRGIGPI